MLLLSWLGALREFTRFIRWIQTERRMATDPETCQSTWAVSPPDNCSYQYRLHSSSRLLILLSWQADTHLTARIGSLYFFFAETEVSNFSLRPKRLEPRFRPIIPSHQQRQKKNYQHSVCGGCYTTLSYDVIYDVFVLFTFAKIEVIWFDTLVSDQSLAILRVLHINQVSGQTFWSQIQVWGFGFSERLWCTVYCCLCDCGVA